MLFHVIVPSLPGFGFSDKPQSTGWTLTRTAKAWAELTKRLGYNRYVTQGGNLGAGVTTHMGRLKPEGLAAIHLNFARVVRDPSSVQQRMSIEMVVEGPVQRNRYQRCWIRRIVTGTSLAGLVARDLQREADWRCIEIALRKCRRCDETKNHGQDFRCHYCPWVCHDAIARYWSARTGTLQ
jgi:pimeloyl-ACP methyl ester carboxylesterase